MFTINKVIIIILRIRLGLKGKIKNSARNKRAGQKGNDQKKTSHDQFFTGNYLRYESFDTDHDCSLCKIRIF